MLRFGVVVIGAQDMDRAERFWCSALGYEERYRLIGLGAQFADWAHYPADPGFVVLEDTEGNKFRIVDASN